MVVWILGVSLCYNKQLKQNKMKTYPKKQPKAYVPRFSQDGTINPASIVAKKTNPANFDKTLPSWNDMTAEEKYQFELEREAAKRGSHSSFY